MTEPSARRRPREPARARHLDLIGSQLQQAALQRCLAVQLVRAHDSTQLWSEKYNGTMEDVFDIQERVARAIAVVVRHMFQAEGGRDGGRHRAGGANPMDEGIGQRTRGGHALLRLENCICTPHIGYVELQSYEMYFNAAFDNVLNYIRGTPTNIVNPGALQVRR